MALTTAVPSFDPVLQPYVSMLPPQICQHSVFTLPKPAYLAEANKPPLSTDDATTAANQDDEDSDYDFIQA